MFDLDFISKLLQDLLLAILPVLALQGVSYLFKALDVQKAKLSAEQRAAITTMVKIAVFAAEQTGLKAKAEGWALDKKKFAIDYVVDQLNKAGLSVDIEAIATEIEAVVLDEFNRCKWEAVSVDTEPKG